ncbi:Threonine/homoserine/homoserine lactone efflux protein [Nocardioides exalbidus]|uniref:Threonine/homoserine/homoserine lactone efflux protein n=1 Tax=Nocardioides exalbidus TaxID=402596 RepID=A0A1H4NLA5_9ACTN|nr:LysE family translocator [Nocardioides exalbidus]SEB95618.1 Threonine/homoserine/homoserine lactone efflux protein [Nocardioides exalbidus]
MPSSSQWLAFLVASFLFVQVPGPSLLFTIGRALTVGRREALLSVLGNGLGVMVQVVLVAIGLGAVVAASAAAYTVVKVAGAAYVVWLGIQAIRHRADARLAMADAMPVRRGHPVRIGLTVGATNPRTMVFFVAFLPQFTDPAGPVLVQTLVLGAVFSAMAIVSDTTWAMVAGAARTWFARRPQRLDALSAGGGTMMIGLGATMLATE